MYQVGDKVVYPVHGAGVVEAIESREVGGLTRDCYILNLPFCGLKVTVPVTAAEQLGLREMMSASEAGRVLDILEGAEGARQPKLPDKWNHRFRLLVDKIKGGDVMELARIVHNLAEREHKKPLASGEKRLYEQAREILFSELWLLKREAEASGLAPRIDEVLREVE